MSIFSSLLGTDNASKVGMTTMQTVDPQLFTNVQDSSKNVMTQYGQEPTGLTQAGQLSADEIERQRNLTLEGVAPQTQSIYNTLSQQQQMSGGQGAGSNARLAQKSLRLGSQAGTEARSKYQDLMAQNAVSDYGAQEDRRYQTVSGDVQNQLGVLNAAGGIVDRSNKINAMNDQYNISQAMDKDAKNKGRFTSLAALGVGAASGNPMLGMAVGGMAANTLS